MAMDNRDNPNNEQNDDNDKKKNEIKTSVIVCMILVLAVLMLFIYVVEQINQTKNIEISYDEFIEKLDKGELKSVEMDVDRLILTPKSKEELKKYKQKVVKEKQQKAKKEESKKNASLEKKEDASEETKEDVVNRYRVQLDLYGEAIEKLTGKEIKEKCVYLFGLDEGISIYNF